MKPCSTHLHRFKGFEREIVQRMYALYLPAPRLRQAGGLMPEEIKIVEETT